MSILTIEMLEELENKVRLVSKRCPDEGLSWNLYMFAEDIDDVIHGLKNFQSMGIPLLQKPTPKKIEVKSKRQRKKERNNPH